MKFREWLQLEAMVSNMIDAGPDGVYLNLDGRKFGPISDLTQQGGQWIAKRMGNPVGIVVDIDPRIAPQLIQKYNQIKQRQTQQRAANTAGWKTHDDLAAKWGKKQGPAGIMVYRGIAGQYDPNWSGSSEQHWIPDRQVAWKTALDKASRTMPPTLLKVFVPEKLIDWNRYDVRNKPRDRVTVHGVQIFDIPNEVLRQLQVEVVPQRLLDQWFGQYSKPY